MSRDHLTRDELVNALATHRRSPYRRRTLERMDAEELAAAANSSGLGFGELQRAAEAGGSGGGSLAALRATFGIAEEGRRRSAENRAEATDLGFEVQNTMSGPRGEAAVDRQGDETRAAESEGGDGLGFQVENTMSGPPGTAAIDRD